MRSYLIDFEFNRGYTRGLYGMIGDRFAAAQPDESTGQLFDGRYWISVESVWLVGLHRIIWFPSCCCFIERLEMDWPADMAESLVADDRPRIGG